MAVFLLLSFYDARGQIVGISNYVSLHQLELQVLYLIMTYKELICNNVNERVAQFFFYSGFIVLHTFWP